MSLEGWSSSGLSCWHTGWQLAGWLTGWLVVAGAGWGWGAGWPQGPQVLRTRVRGVILRSFGGPRTRYLSRKLVTIHSGLGTRELSAYWKQASQPGGSQGAGGFWVVFGTPFGVTSDISWRQKSDLGCPNSGRIRRFFFVKISLTNMDFF